MKVFVVDDAPQTRLELVELLTAVEGLEVVGQAGSVDEALTGLEATVPKAVTLDEDDRSDIHSIPRPSSDRES